MGAKGLGLNGRKIEDVFGMTREEAWSRGVCIRCHNDWRPRTRSINGEQEYKLRALCEQCSNEIFRRE